MKNQVSRVIACNKKSGGSDAQAANEGYRTDNHHPSLTENYYTNDLILYGTHIYCFIKGFEVHGVVPAYVLLPSNYREVIDWRVCACNWSTGST